MSDLVERLRSGRTQGMQTWPELCHQAAARISELEQQLAARDGEIADWLRGEAAPLREKAIVPASFMVAQASALEQAATAIASGAYRSNADARPRAEGE